jgi:excisionase family DNA binding protein
VTRRWITVEEAAQRAGVSVDTVYRAIRRGAVEARKMGAQWRLLPEWVDDWQEPAQAPVQRRRARSVTSAAQHQRAVASTLMQIGEEAA